MNQKQQTQEKLNEIKSWLIPMRDQLNEAFVELSLFDSVDAEHAIEKISIRKTRIKELAVHLLASLNDTPLKSDCRMLSPQASNRIWKALEGYITDEIADENVEEAKSIINKPGPNGYY